MRKKIAVFAAMWAFSGAALAVGGIADVTIYDRTEGRVLPVYRHEGRCYVAGRPGNEYQIRVRNRTGAEILTVISVDGVNAVSGETADWGQAGYVLDPYQNYGVRGWRKSLQRIAAFYFTRHENSYAARTGRPDNVGVLGVAVFRKKIRPEPRLGRDAARLEAPAQDNASAESSRSRPAQPADSPASTPGAHESGAGTASGDRAPRASTAPWPQQKLGTGHGRSEASQVTYADFERAGTTPDEVITIYYDTYRNLVAQGVIRPPKVAGPDPFPGRFVPDPQ